MPRQGQMEDEAGCPTPTAHRRLEEAHRLWHECLDAYQDPSGFRTYLNACIQALRNVTWVLQKEKRLIDGFDEWYPAWQARLKEDAIMRWIVKSRNRIVKEGDLETESLAVARVITSYADAAAEVAADLDRVTQRKAGSADPQPEGSDTVREISAPPRYSLHEILHMVASLPIPSRTLRQSTLTIERRWVDMALPDHELLAALGHAYGVAQQLVNDAHDRVGRPHAVVLPHREGVAIDARELHEGRLACMVTSRRIRTFAISLDDLTPETGGQAWPMTSPDPEAAAMAVAKYGVQPEWPESIESPVDLVPTYVELGRQILATDADHGWFVFFFVGPKMVHAETLMARNNADKRDLAQRVADLAAMNGIDGLIVVGEAWMAPLLLDEEGAFIPPAEHPDREEYLMIHGEDAAGRVHAVHLPFVRREGEPTVVGDPIDMSDTHYQFLDPVRAIWRSADGHG